MQGKIKWFSEEKGYGYIVAENGKDHYFNVREIQGSVLPRNGDLVIFESSEGGKGPRAISVVITEKSSPGSRLQSNQRVDDRVDCTHCGKKMVPRLILYKGEPQKSLCPFCGGVYKNFGCFIATAVYGDYYAPEVIALRRFRDETLEMNVLGRIFIIFYYKFSPSIAVFLIDKPRLSSFVRFFLSILSRHHS
jgi:cold shock CspA family protein